MKSFHWVGGKSYYLLCAAAVLFYACRSDEGQTPEFDTTDLWPAGVTHTMYTNGPADYDPDYDRYPEDALYGYINRKGKMIIRPQFVSAGSFSCGYAPVELKLDKQSFEYAFIDKNGEVHPINGYPNDGEIPLTLSPFYYNIAIMYDPTDNYHSAWMVDRQMHVVSGRISQGRLYPMTADGLAALVGTETDEVAHYDPSGKKVLQTSATPIDPQFKDGYMILNYGSQNSGPAAQYSIVDKTGTVVYQDSLSLYNLGHQRFLRRHTVQHSSEQFDVIDVYGHVLGTEDFSAPAYREEKQFLVSHTRHEGLYENMPLYYYVNQDGKQTIERSFATAEPFYEGYAIVSSLDNPDAETPELQYEIINLQGETVLILGKGEVPTRVHNGLVLTSRTDYPDKSKDEAVIYYAYKDLNGNVIYSWEVKLIQSAPVQSIRRCMIHTFPEGLYMLGVSF